MKILKLFILLSSIIFAGSLKDIPATKDFVKKDIKIIDIRTPSEWRETGIIKNSYPIMFFDDRGKYDVERFVSEVNKVVKDGEEFAIICRTGSRTTYLAPFFANKLGYNVINLKGGIMNLRYQGYKFERYGK